MKKINNPKYFFKSPTTYLMELGRQSYAMSLLPALLESQWLPHKTSKQRQISELKDFLKYCKSEIPYYSRLFIEKGFSPDHLNSVNDLSSLPLLDKDCVRELYDDLKPKNFKNCVTKSKVTSGSTGVPLTFHLDGLAHSFLWAQIWRAWAQLNYKPGDLYATLAGGALLPDNVSIIKKIYMTLSRSINMPCYHMDEKLLERYASILQDRSTKILYGYPSSIELLALYILSSSSRIPKVSSIVTTSELLSDTARNTIEKAFGCNVFDTYGCNDAGLYSFECEHHHGYHIGMESVVVEVVDDQGVPLPNGQVGRIVTTHLANRCFPLVRYITGDLGAIETSDCSCGRGLERVIKLQGREADFVTTPDGRKVLHPFFLFFEPFHDFKWIKRWQIYQPTKMNLVIRLQSDYHPTTEEKNIIVAEMRKGLGDLDIRVEMVDEFETTKKGKFRMIISEL